MLDRFKSLTFSDAAIDELYKYYSRYSGSVPPTHEDFLEFSRTGNRLNYENKYFALRHRINGTFMLWRAKGGEYLDELRELLFIVCDEETWALPAHVSNPDKARTEIDLFAAETAMMLAEIKYLANAIGALGNELNDRINKEIRERIFIPFSKNRYHWETAEHNWSAVCAGAIGIAYLRIAPRELPLERILDSMRAYVSGYNDDGICLEGIGYWSYGFGFYLYFAQALFEICGINIIHTDKLQKIALFPQNVMLSGSTTVTCSDAPEEFAAPEGLMEMIREFSGSSGSIGSSGGIGIPANVRTEKTDECGRWAHFIRSYLYPVTETKIPTVPRGEFVFEQSQWYVNRKPHYAFFIKGGTNGEPHNHNDIGSFIISDENRQLLCDLGAGEYTKDYFNDETRYNYLCNSSFGHSVPIIDGSGQRAGAEYRCDGFDCGNSIARVSFGNAYGNGISASREMRFSEDKIILHDTFSFADKKIHNIIERFVTTVEPLLTDGGIIIGSLKMNKTGDIKKETIRAHDGKPRIVYLIDIQSDNEFEIEFLLMNQKGTAL